MKPKAHLLIVEDKALLYKRLSMALKAENFSVGPFLPSVEKAILEINKTIPDLVLLDIDLEGERTGLELGKLLSEQYNIPFIYVTDYQDDHTFFESLQTNHENYLVKTKPHLDTKQVIRAIHTVLSKRNKDPNLLSKDSMLCYTGYINDLKQLGKDAISEVPVLFEDIVVISTKDEVGNKLKPNYLHVRTFHPKSYFLPTSLTDIKTILPLDFARINESEIVNLSAHTLDGRINGSRLQIGDTVYHISKTYKPEIEQRFEILYQKLK